jgi:hypothetical protein
MSSRCSDSVSPEYATASIPRATSHSATRFASATVRQYTIPEPGSIGIVCASHAMRCACDGMSSTERCRLSRSSGPRSTSNRSPAWATMSSTTRLFAVAVVQSTGTSAGSIGSTRAMRR